MAETEKITINLSPVDMGEIDLLVQEGLYSNRTDFIRSAIRNQLSVHGEVLKQAVIRKSLAIGLISYSRQDLERFRAAGEKLAIRAVGVVALPEDISPELADETIASLEVHGVLKASDAVKQILASRIHS